MSTNGGAPASVMEDAAYQSSARVTTRSPPASLTPLAEATSMRRSSTTHEPDPRNAPHGWRALRAGRAAQGAVERRPGADLGGPADVGRLPHRVAVDRPLGLH